MTILTTCRELETITREYHKLIETKFGETEIQKLEMGINLLGQRTTDSFVECEIVEKYLRTHRQTLSQKYEVILFAWHLGKISRRQRETEYNLVKKLIAKKGIIVIIDQIYPYRIKKRNEINKTIEQRMVENKKLIASDSGAGIYEEQRHRNLKANIYLSNEYKIIEGMGVKKFYEREIGTNTMWGFGI